MRNLNKIEIPPGFVAPEMTHEPRTFLLSKLGVDLDFWCPADSCLFNLVYTQYVKRKREKQTQFNIIANIITNL